MVRRWWILAGVVAGLTLAPVHGGAEEADPVVAMVDGETIVRSEVLELAQSLPPEYRAQLGSLIPALIDQLVNVKLVASAAREAGLAEDEEVQRRMEARRLDVMRDVYLERHLESRVTDEKLAARYEAFAASAPAVPEVHARHILLETEAEAREVIAALDGGADFVELAQSRSTGPTAETGGDLGYFNESQMVPEFSSAAFSMEPGSHSVEPVQSEFGWHVIKIEDRRDKTAPPFAEIEEQLRRELSREAVSAMLAGLRNDAEIEIVMNPADFPAIGTPGAGAGTQ